jgi:hypothetical protein
MRIDIHALNVSDRWAHQTARHAARTTKKSRHELRPTASIKLAPFHTQHTGGGRAGRAGRACPRRCWRSALARFPAVRVFTLTFRPGLRDIFVHLCSGRVDTVGGHVILQEGAARYKHSIFARCRATTIRVTTASRLGCSDLEDIVAEKPIGLAKGCLGCSSQFGADIYTLVLAIGANPLAERFSCRQTSNSARNQPVRPRPRDP